MENFDSQIIQAEAAITGKYNPTVPTHIVRQGFNKPLLGKNDLVTIYNSKDERAVKIKNALGFDFEITTLTQIIDGVTQQKFYDVNIADFVTVKTGQGAWMDEILKWRSYDLIDNNLATGDVGVGSGKISSVDVGLDSVTFPLQKWAKQAQYNLITIKTASENQRWDIITQLEEAKRRSFDLGLQKLAFLGHSTNAGIKGLLNQTGVTANTTLITKLISTMTAAEINTFIGTMVGSYFTNSGSTMKPNTLVMPTVDYLGMANAPSADFPIGKSRMEYLLDALKSVCGADFKILDSAYCSQVNNNLSKNRYALYNRDESNIFMPLPIPYTTLLQGTANNFDFTSVSYAQYSGIALMRPLSMLYMDFANA
jgi:hypothetical protein